MGTYYYVTNPYDTIEQAQAAATAQLQELGQKPSIWCIVKELVPNSDGTFTVPSDALDDMVALNLPADGYFSVSSEVSGDTYTGIGAVEAAQRIAEFRTQYINYNNLSKITFFDEIPTEADFSSYM